MKSLYDYCAEHSDDALLRQWHHSKNETLKPESVAAYSHKKAWWVCEKGHEWEACISSRVREKTGCPVCMRRRLLIGENDLATLFPDLAGEWHPEKNGSLTPAQVMPGSRLKVWWQCKKGHEWEASLVSRTLSKTDCPACAGKVVIPGANDLRSLYPEIAVQWHKQKNGPLRPENLLAHSARTAWWQCEKGHEWKAVVSSRTVQRAGCPYCAGRKVLVGFNDLATANPELAAQWHPALNGPLTPEQVTKGCNKKVWWQCEKGHTWQAKVSSRDTQGNGCPYCAGKKVWAGFNDLATVEPKIAAQWHPTLNGTLTPEQVTIGCNKRVWWVCSDGHVWKAMIAFRAGGRKNGCPVCAGKVKKDKVTKYGAIMADSAFKNDKTHSPGGM